MRRVTMMPVVLGLICWQAGALVGTAAPPPPGIQSNSLDITSPGGLRYRPQRRTVSPYLALVPGGLGNLAAINYFNVVQPEVVQLQINAQQEVALQKLEAQTTAVAAEEAEGEAKAIIRQRSSFMTHRKYFGQPIYGSTQAKPDKK